MYNHSRKQVEYSQYKICIHTHVYILYKHFYILNIKIVFGWTHVHFENVPNLHIYSRNHSYFIKLSEMIARDEILYIWLTTKYIE